MTPLSKSSEGTVTNTSKNPQTLTGIYKSGQAIPYDSPITYDGNDPWFNRPVNYDSVGSNPTWANQSKS